MCNQDSLNPHPPCRFPRINYTFSDYRNLGIETQIWDSREELEQYIDVEFLIKNPPERIKYAGSNFLAIRAFAFALFEKIFS